MPTFITDAPLPPDQTRSLDSALAFGKQQWQTTWRTWARQWTQPALIKLAAETLGCRALHSSQIAGFQNGQLRDPSPKLLLAVGAALLLAAQARLHPNWLTRQAMGVVSLGYAVPGAVIVVGLLLPVGWVQATWPQSGVGFWLTATVLGLVWAYLVRFVAVAIQSVGSGYARIPSSLDESARLLGVSGWRLVTAVHVPLLRKPVAVALLLVLVDVMKELPATLMLRPFNTDTLAVMAYQLARDERLAEAALPSLALVVVGLLPVVLLSRSLRQRPPQT
jgi:iron(III) transport system permease protein